MMETLFGFELTPIFWVGMAAFLMMIELLSGSGFLLGLALSAGLMSATIWLFSSMSSGLQLLFFSCYALLTIIYWCIYLRQRPEYVNRTGLNKRAEQNIGQVHTLEENLVNGIGKIKIGDTVWLVRSEEALSVGSEVIVSGVDGTILLIKKKNHPPSKLP